WSALTAPDGAGASDTTSVAIGSDGEKLYYAAYSDNAGVERFFTSSSNLDGSGFSGWTNQTAPDGGGDNDGSGIDMAVANGKLYFAAYLHSDAVEAFLTANSNLDGSDFSGWTSQSAPNGAGAAETTGVAMDTDGLKMYYSAFAHNGEVEVFFTANSNMNGTGFSSWTSQTPPNGTGATNYCYHDMVLVGNALYYASFTHNNTLNNFSLAYSLFNGSSFSGWTVYPAIGSAGAAESSSVSLASDGKLLYILSFGHNGAVEAINLTTATLPSQAILFKNNSYELMANAGGFVFDWNGVPRSMTNISLGSWHHVAISHNGTAIQYFADGTRMLWDNTTRDFNITANALLIAGGYDYFNGTIDEVKISNLSYSPNQIYQEYLAGANSRSVNILMGDELSVADNWHCQATPNDGYQDGTARNSSSVLVINLAPSISSISISPIVANTSDTLSCNVTATDTENLTLQVEWFWYNSSTLKFSGNTSGVISGINTAVATLGPLNTTKFELWNCTARVYDGWNYSGYNSTTINISNAPPTQDIPTITPALPNITSNLTCNWNNVNDIDSDSIVNITNWYRNNVSTTVLYMPFDGANGREGTNATDYSGYGNNGTVFGAVWNRTGGKISGGYNFDGVSSYIEIPHSTVLEPATKLSITAWIKIATNASSTNYNIVAKQNWPSKQGYRLSLGGYGGCDKTNCLFLGIGNGSTLDETPGLGFVNLTNNTKWYYVSAVYNGSTIKYYIDGALTSSTSTNLNFIAPSATAVAIGRHSQGAEYFPGTIDELKIYNISLTTDQIYADYQAGLLSHSTNILVNSETSQNESWHCSVTPNDGYSDGTTLNSSSVSMENLVPDISTPIFNPAAPNTTSEVQCLATPTDPEDAELTAEWYWYNGTDLIFSGNTTGLASGVSAAITTLGSGNTTKGETWNCTVRSFDGFNYSSFDSATITILNSRPDIPILLTPSNGNITYHERYPFFDWTSTDVDGDLLNFTINTSFSSLFYCGTNISANVSTENYTADTEFCVDNLIYWEVMASDGTDNSAWSERWNFTIESYISLTLTTNQIDFGNIVRNLSKDTDDGYLPLILENTGNIRVNISRIGANASLWDTEGLNTEYFQFKADNDSTEPGSFNWTASTITWTNVTSIATQNLTIIKDIEYNDTKDNAEIDIRVQVPLYDSATSKKSSIYIVGEQS
ncbi:MAG: LamG domain-containing protein, partial [Nanoarchaeota archaeon]|nr:LamG domain-containing protein [Nanoarchaeota archaeon]